MMEDKSLRSVPDAGQNDDGRGNADVAKHQQTAIVRDTQHGMVRRGRALGILAAAVLAFTLPSGHNVAADPAHSQVASAGETAKSSQIGSYGMLPIYPRDIEDGTYDVTVESSSHFFRIHDASLTVKDGKMSVRIRLDSSSYELVYPGTGEEAAKAEASDYVKITEDDEEWSVFTLPVESLDAGFPCAAFSIKKQKWYDRTLLIEASSLPKKALKVDLPDYEAIEKAFEAEGVDPSTLGSTDSGAESASEAVSGGSDETNAGTAGGSETTSSANGISGSDETIAAGSGASSVTGGENRNISDETGEQRDSSGPEPVEMETYPDGKYSVEVSLTGGSGRASVSSPALLTVKDGLTYATLIWSSSYYDYMIVDGEQFDNENSGGASTFTIPVTAFDEPVKVTADTTAMGDPVEIQYGLCFYYSTIGDDDLIPQVAARKVLLIAVVIIAAGAVLSFLTRKMRYR